MIEEESKERIARTEGSDPYGEKMGNQFSQFGKEYYRDDDITYADKEKSKKEFMEFLEKYTENNVQINNGEEMVMFSNKFIELFDAAF